MGLSLEREIEGLEQLLNSTRDPEGRGFVPLADAYRRRGDLALALEVLADGLDRHPTFASAYVVAARVHRDRGDHTAENAAWAHVLGLDPENTEALEAVAKAHPPASDGDAPAVVGAEAAFTDEPAPSTEEAPASANEATASADEPLDRVEASPEVSASADNVLVEAALAWSDASADDVFDAPEDPAFLESVAASVEPSIEPRLDPSTDDVRVSPDDEGEVLPATRTLAELLVRQGFADRAARIYEQLLAKEPGDPTLEARLAELRSGTTPAAEPARVRARPIPRPTREQETEDQAEQMSRGAPVSDRSDSPFAWGGSDSLHDGDIAAETSPGGTIGDYFARLLAWTPAAAGMADAAAQTAPEILATAVQVVNAAGDDIARQAVPIESLAPDAVPIESLAPDSVTAS